MRKMNLKKLFKVSVLTFAAAICLSLFAYNAEDVKAQESVSGNNVTFVQTWDPVELQRWGGSPHDITITGDVPTYDEVKELLDPYYKGKIGYRDDNKIMFDELEYYNSNSSHDELGKYDPQKAITFNAKGGKYEGKTGVYVMVKVTKYHEITEEPKEEAPKAEVKEEEPVVIEVPQTPENNYSVFQEAIANDIEEAIVAATKVNTNVNSNNNVNNTTQAVEPIKIDTWNWISFKGNVYQKMQDSGLPVQISFRHKGIRYRVNIPANADLMSLVDENGYCGFLNLMAHFGGTVIDK